MAVVYQKCGAVSIRFTTLRVVGGSEGVRIVIYPHDRAHLGGIVIKMGL
jgi:hypothetical protein